MFVEESKKVFSDVCLQRFAVGYYFLLAVDKLVFRYTHSWRYVDHNMVWFRKIYLLMLIFVRSAFRWTVEFDWL